MRDRSEALAYIRCICDIAMRRKHNGAQARCVGGITDVGVGGVLGLAVVEDFP
jgi:hypothetical protein